MSSLSPSLETAVLSSPQSLSPCTPRLDTVSRTSSSTHLSPPKDCSASFTVSRATSEATTAAPPPAPPANADHLALRPTSSLHSLFSKYKPPALLGGRPSPSSETTSEMVSRGSCVKREEEMQVDELLLENTHTFRVSPPLVEMATAVNTTPVTAAGTEEAKEESPAQENTVVDVSKGDSGGLQASSPNQRVRPTFLTRLSLQLETSTTTKTTARGRAVDSCNPQRHRIAPHNLTSPSSLRLPDAVASARQALVSTVLYPVSPSSGQGSPRRPLPAWSPSGSLVASNVSAQWSPPEDREQPRPLMGFPVFSGLTETVLNRSSRSIRGGASVRSSRRSRGRGLTTPRERPAVATPPVAAPSCPANPSSPHVGPATDGPSREKSEALGSTLADTPSRLSESVSGVFPLLSPFTSLGATATTGAVLSSEEIIVPGSSGSRSLADVRDSARRRGSTPRQGPGVALSVSEILTSSNCLPTAVNTTTTSSSLPPSAPSVQLCAPVPRHLYRVAHDGHASVEPLAPPDGRRVSPLPAITPVNSLSSATANGSVDSSRPLSYVNSLGSSLPPLSSQVSNSTAQETSAPCLERASSAVYVGDLSCASRGNVSRSTRAESAGPRSSLLGHLFQEPKRHKNRVWVNTGSDDPSPFPSNGQRKDHHA
ncbi:hypothetical protein ABB37_09523 [Leptomonas pyrrhocoris]|uniref:Uncharacterized protein n=1 Tax=Leptomonas pyrrhocoris TaxID=157538 RepID=A0A0M9FQH2_LEPPY|nr:hypothetical protein ABB37_09523 [Leptomonas pyrrhocoris]KPA73927.1 hypothetical protein ABB37_09523 [Leptomonas pyrrhocoris]|eukprot:XP_015652366.1 hypothetical protein ABB37_09523 [Leptomonas pyrrhocoris]